MPDQDIVDRIDATLEAWERGPDAARWAGEPSTTEQPQRRVLWGDLSQQQRSEALIEMMAAMGVSFTEFRQAFVRAADQVQLFVASFRRVQQIIDPPPPRPKAAADRTNSRRRRAGMRRTKHRARR